MSSELVHQLVQELANEFHIETKIEKNLHKEYNKLSRILKVIVNEHGGAIKKKDWKWINSTEEYSPYSTTISDDGTKIIIGVQ